MISELKIKINSLLSDIERDQPAYFPEDEYRKEVVKYGRKKLADALVEEARLRYQAEKELLENGFRLNCLGKWVKDN